MPVCLWSTPPRSPAVWLMQLKKKKKALLFLTRGGVSDTPHPSFFRRSGEWTHADWLCGCVKGYPTSCSPSLQTAAAAESGGSAIFSLLCVCVCVCLVRKRSNFSSSDSISWIADAVILLGHIFLGQVSLFLQRGSCALWCIMHCFFIIFFKICNVSSETKPLGSSPEK